MLERFLASQVGRFASRWAFVLPWAALSLGQPSHTDGVCAGATATHYAAPFYVSCVAGAAWQVLNRRDLVDRVSIWAVLLVVAIGVGSLVSHDCAANVLLTLVGLLGVAAGVVLAEAWHRHRDKRAATRLPFSQDELREQADEA